MYFPQIFVVAIECSLGLVQNLTSVVENELLKLRDQSINEKLQNFSPKLHSWRKNVFSMSDQVRCLIKKTQTTKKKNPKLTQKDS